jgi:hypothetical protein
MLGIKKLKPNELEENYLQYLKKMRVYLLAQKKLLETSLNWAILTIYPILILFFVGVWEIPLARYVAVVSLLAMAGLGIHEYYLRKRRVKNEIMPRISRIDELIESLEE